MTTSRDMDAAHPDGSFAQSPLHDPVFEPHTGFSFEDANDEDIRNMQRNMASMQGFTGSEFHFQDIHGANNMQDGMYAPHINAFTDGSSAFQHGHSGMFDREDMDPGDLNTWQAQMPSMGNSSQAQFDRRQSYQEGIVNSRHNSVSHHFGQITPPDEGSDSFAVALKSQSKGSPGKVPKLDKSERARNAANQRHAKSKKARKDSQQEEESDAGEEGDVENKKEKYREKNRVAAAKCRAKKKENVESLEDQHRRLNADHSMLRQAEQQLRDELTLWKTKALEHTDCRCSSIQRYNQRQAQHLVYGSQGSNMPPPHARRTYSVPGPAPAPVQIPPRHQSFAVGTYANNFAFAPVTTAESMGLTATVSDNHMSDFSQHSSPNE